MVAQEACWIPCGLADSLETLTRLQMMRKNHGKVWDLMVRNRTDPEKAGPSRRDFGELFILLSFFICPPLPPPAVA